MAVAVARSAQLKLGQIVRLEKYRFMMRTDESARWLVDNAEMGACCPTCGDLGNNGWTGWRPDRRITAKEMKQSDEDGLGSRSLDQTLRNLLTSLHRIQNPQTCGGTTDS